MRHRTDVYLQSGMVCLVCGALKNQRAKQIRVGSGTHVETVHDGVQLHHETAGEQS
ncbi:hypothetical protein MCC01983_14180 [Bifidobacteriaceae bacterium MCC01983]|nr:hypothetical protein MCC01983_14180 [Bifidobacteriaceae bacterium MCC01983]